MKTTIFLCSLICITSLPAAEIKPIHRINPTELKARLQADATTVEVHRNGLHDVMRFVKSRPELFPTDGFKPWTGLGIEKTLSGREPGGGTRYWWTVCKRNAGREVCWSIFLRWYQR